MTLTFVCCQKLEAMVTTAALVFLLLVKHGTLAASSIPEQVFSIQEEVPAGTVVGTIGDEMADAPPKPYHTLILNNNAASTDLEISDYGVIKTQVKLDREVTSQYTWFVVSQVNPAARMKVVVNVLDINDHAPVFTESSKRIMLSESTPKSSDYFLGSAIDRDSGINSTQGYVIESGNEGDAFLLKTKRKNNILYLDLEVNGVLDYEENPSYLLKIRAFDGGNPPKVGYMYVNITLVDTNDNQPIFNQSRYSAKVAENATVGTSVLQVFATDQDSGNNGKLQYYIDHVKSDSQQNFEINPTSGVVYVNKKLDYEKKAMYELIVIAKDNGTQQLSATAVVSIAISDINDNQPQINLVFRTDDGTNRLPETVREGDYIAQVSVSDPDLPGQLVPVNVTLSGGDGFFGLDKKSDKIYFVKIAKPLDRDGRDYYRMTLVATDSGTPPLRAEKSFILRINDKQTENNQPSFRLSTYSADIQALAPVGSSVVQVSASDIDAADSVLTYKLQDSTKKFQIDRHSGLITTRSSMDCETTEVRLTVTAEDSGIPPLTATATVVVRLQSTNDNQPVFDQSFYNASIREDEPVDKCFLKVAATDPDCGQGSQVTYRIQDSQGFPLPAELRVHPNTGWICVASALDYETRTRYEFPVVASDRGGLQTTAIVLVTVRDVNDNKPVFNPRNYQLNLKRTSTVGTSLLVVQATDPDTGAAGTVRYDLVDGNNAGYFKIQTSTGALTLQKSLQSSPSTFRLLVRARDGEGLVSSQHATVDIRLVEGQQQQPVFSLSLYSFQVVEDASMATTVGRVQATSPGGGVSYSIASASTPGLFTLGVSDGVVRPAQQLDHETVPYVLLTVQAQYGNPPSSSQAQVNISITDVNDNSPVFSVPMVTISVKEDAKKFSDILYTTHAEDADSDRYGMVEYFLDDTSGTFFVDRSSGQIKIHKDLDYEQQKQYTILVTAQDQGLPVPHTATMTLTVNVKDINDNAPQLEKDNYKLQVNESIATNSELVRVKATDADSGNNARITYRLAGAYDPRVFGIFGNTGVIYNKVMLDRETEDKYSFSVIASDYGLPQLSATATIDITVLDVNDNPPKFEKDSYSFALEEEMRAGTSVGSVTATDRDRLSLFEYYIQGSNLYFDISSTGQITTKRPLDREAQEVHQFTVEVRDGPVRYQTATAVVTVEVLDKNDNPPVFMLTTDGQYTGYVMENKPAGTIVLKAVVEDKDTGKNAKVRFGFDKDAGDDAKPFSIDPDTGEITTQQVLDHEVKKKYTFDIKAYDSGVPTQMSKTTVNVIVDDENESAPVFASSTIYLNLPEDTKPGTLVDYVTAKDLDSGENARILYYIINGNVGNFVLNRTTGALHVARPLDYDSGQHYHILQVQAVDSSSTNPKSSIVTVNISLTDVNDNPPKFTRDSIYIFVPENIQVDSQVDTITATDADSGLYGQVTYSIISQTPNQLYFQIDSRSGAVIVKSLLDYEVVSDIVLTVRATDSHPNPQKRLWTDTNVWVVVEDKNDNAPVFQSRSEVHILEDEPRGYPILHVIATDADSPANGNVSYTITSGNEEGHFSLHPVNGLLSIAEPLDREQTEDYQLVVSASDQGQPPRITQQTLNIIVQDVNDNQPHFQRALYTASVRENRVVGSVVTTIRATDRDTGENAELTYLIPEGITHDKFSVGEKTGVIYTSTELDREEQDSWTLTVYVKDGAFPALYDRTSILITVEDENDNYPYFTNPVYELKVPENSKMAVIHTIKASDADAGQNSIISYDIIDGDDNNLFHIDESAGTLSCDPLDREVRSSYNLTIQARDHGNPPHANTSSIVIHVLDDNDNDPVFRQSLYTKTISEDIESGVSILQVQAEDADAGVNARISYTLDNGAEGLFKIENDTGILRTAGEFDREKKSEYTFQVHATDGGLYGPRAENVRVEITISDVNDNAPVFEKIPYKANIAQNHPVGSSVIKVLAVDPDYDKNGQVSYRILTQTDYFDIEPDSGVVKTKIVLGPTSIRVHRLSILARDSGTTAKSSTGVVEITVGNAPGVSTLHFSNHTYNVNLPENSPRDTSVVRVQARFDSGETNGITYSFASGHEDNTFNIDSSTGLISVENPTLLDYEMTTRLRLIIVATSETQAYGYTTVYVNLQDQNDNAPKFAQDRYTSSVWEGNGRGTYVTQIMAADADKDENGEITYRIVQGDPHHAFVIDPVYSGIVKTNVILDREIQDSYKLIIEAMDAGRPRKASRCTLKIQVIDQNDNAPKFGPYPPVHVREGTKVGTMLLLVTANDVDLNPTLTYDFTSDGNPGGVFSIDRFSGKISLAKELDYETNSKYILKVKASDKENTATTNITIEVEDVNDNVPEVPQQTYQVILPEETPAHHPVITIEATDRDDGENARLTYSMLNVQGFYIDPNNGTIYTNSAVTFNPSQPTIHLVVTARDHGTPSLSVVVAVWVQTIDINNNKPEFERAVYNVQIEENKPVGTTVVQVTAVDKDDSPENKKVDYSIIRGNEAGAFQISSSLGEIIVVSPLDREHQAEYSLTIEARDRGTPQRSSSTVVKIELSDVNDNKPIFNKSQYSVEVVEDIKVGNELLKVYASDKDSGDNGRIVYTVSSGDEDKLFYINPQTGMLFVNKSLDYEKATSHRLIVQATDSSPDVDARHTAFVAVEVKVTDVNEFTPKFEVMMYLEYVTEKQDPGQYVFTAAAHDNDKGKYGSDFLVYDIVGANEYFVIDRPTGRVTTAVEFTYTVNSSYTFNVTATDKGGLKARAPVSVTVKPAEDNVPVFSQPEYAFSVPGNAKANHVIGKISAQDPSGGKVYFTLEEETDYFAINLTTGILTVEKDLQAEEEVERQKRRKRSLSPSRSKRALREDSVTLIIVASGGPRRLQKNKVFAHMDIDRECGGCALPRVASGGLSTAMVLVITFVILAVILIAVLVLLYVRSRYRRTKQPSMPAHSYDSSFDSLSVQPPPPPHEIPPPYNDIHSYRTQSHPTTSDISDQSNSASSGRGSVEEEDEEIRMINSSSVEGKALVRGGMPDSGIQQDDDAMSEISVQNHQEYFAKLGIDTSKLNSSGKGGLATSVESMHQFSDEGGGEGDGMDIATVPYDDKLDGAGPQTSSSMNTSVDYGLGDMEPSHGGSLSSVINSEEEFSGSYNWDYLLDWGPQYQPLADVFAEIARLKDDAVVPKKAPTKIVPQRHSNSSLHTQPKTFPPPMITDMPPISLGGHRRSKGKSSQGTESSSNSVGHSARTSQLTSLPSLPRSPISHDSSYTTPVFSPSFTPSLSPLGTRSPSISPLMTPKGMGSSGHTTPRGQSQSNHPTLVLDSFNHAEQELHI